MIRPKAAPEPGEVGRCTQFEQAGVLTSRHCDGVLEAGLCTRAIGFLPPERDLSTEAMQICKKVTLAGLFDEGQAVLQRSLRPVQVSRGQQSLRQIAHDQRISDVSTGFAQCDAGL